jgi:hypothetical protein
VPASDRAFRALARARPDVLLELIRIARPDLLPPADVLTPEAVDDPHLDLPPAVDADLIARLGNSEVLHVEAQGYHDPDFEERLFQYHLRLVLRYRDRVIHTVALWLRNPPSRSSRTMESGGVVVPVASITLADLPASLLLANPLTVCFAPGADLEGQDAEVLCARVAVRLRELDATWPELCMAVAAAATRGRKDAMIRAMRQANEPLIIEDLIYIGLDEGLAKGRVEGLEQGRLEGVAQGRLEGVEQGRLEMARESLLELLAVRGFVPTSTERARMESERSLVELKLWLRRAATARSIAEVLG